MKKFKRSTWLTLILFVYVSAMAIYFLPRNTEIGDTEKYLTIGFAYLIIVFLWIVLRKKEKYKERREAEMKEISEKRKREE